MQKDSREFAIMLLSIMVSRAGGEVTFTQADIDDLGAGSMLRQLISPTDGTVSLKLMTTDEEVAADIVAVQAKNPDLVTTDHRPEQRIAKNIDEAGRPFETGFHPVFEDKQVLGGIMTVLAERLAGLDTDIIVSPPDFLGCANRTLIQDVTSDGVKLRVIKATGH